MDKNIPLSTEVNSIDTSHTEDDEISTMINEINFDEIFSSVNISENYFIKEISPCINDQFSIPSINKIIGIYWKKIFKNLVPKKCNYKLIILILRFVHIATFIFIIFGPLLPSKILSYHIILCIKTLVLWEYFDNKYYLSIAIKKLCNLNEYPELFPFDSSFSKKFILVVMFISIISILIPYLSLFKILYKIFNSLKKYD